MGECYWCKSPWCDPRGSCQEPDYGELEEKAMQEEKDRE